MLINMDGFLTVLLVLSISVYANSLVKACQFKFIMCFGFTKNVISFRKK